MDKISKGINVLMLGSDMSIISDHNTDSKQRMIDYGRLVNRLDIAIYNGNFFSSSDEAYQVSGNVFAYPRSFMGLLALFRVGRKLSFVLNHRIDLITSQDPFILGWISCRLAKWLRTSLHVQIHTDLFSPYFKKESFYNRFKIMMARRILKRADGIRVVSNKIKNSLKNEIPSLKVEPVVLPVWIQLDKFKKEKDHSFLKEKYPQFNKHLLMASRLTREKNIGMMIRVMKDVLRKTPNVGLIIVGDGPLKNNVLSSIRGHGLSKNVILEEWTDVLEKYYNSADLFINTSDYEGFGRTIVEALASGTPVITTEVGCANDYIVKGENGFIIPVKGKKELSSALVEFLGDQELENRLKEGAKRTNPKFLSKEEYLEMYARGWNDSL